MQAATYVLFGTAGSGKGTQAELLVNFLQKKYSQDSPHVSLGSEFRNLADSGAYSGKIIGDSISRGIYQPDFVTNSVFMNFLFKNFDPGKNLVTDGYPRTLEQSKFLERSMDFLGRKNVKVINLVVSEEEVIKRMKLRARNDDTEEGTKKRFSEHENNVIPAMNYFKNKENYEFYEINGEQSVEDVHKDIIEALKL